MIQIQLSFSVFFSTALVYKVPYMKEVREIKKVVDA